MALTAGHCVYNPSCGGFAKSITVWPGRNGTYTPYGSVVVDSVYIPIEYYRTQDEKFDYAALGFIPSNLPSVLRSHSYLGTRVYNDANAGGQYIRIDGYPGKIPDDELEKKLEEQLGEVEGRFWGSMGFVERDPVNYFHCWRYSMDMTGDMSGTPLVTLAGAEEPNRVVGVHTGGTNDPLINPYNYAVRMNQRMFRFAASFRVHGEDWGNA